MHFFEKACLGLLLLSPCLGCGPQMATVSGTVTVDGQPLKTGAISYVAADGSGDAITASIENGKYELTTLVGKKLVQISAPVVVGTRREYNSPDAPTVEITEESLPDKYHSQTELTFEVTSGPLIKDWSLESKAKSR